MPARAVSGPGGAGVGPGRDVAGDELTVVDGDDDTAGAVLFVPLALTESSAWRIPQHLATTAVCLAVLVLGCSIAAMALYNRALADLSPSTAVNALNLVPLWGVIIAIAFLHESLKPLHIAGALLVITGVTLTTKTERTTQP